MGGCTELTGRFKLQAFQARRLAALHAKKEAELQQSLAAGREVQLEIWRVGLAGLG